MEIKYKPRAYKQTLFRWKSMVFRWPVEGDSGAAKPQTVRRAGCSGMKGYGYYSESLFKAIYI